MNLIDNATQCHKLWSIRWALIGGVLNAAGGAWTAFNGSLPPATWASVNMFLMMAIAVSRIIKQDPAPSGEDGK